MFSLFSNALLAVISALYAKLLVVMGLAFPMTEVISDHVASSSYLVSIEALEIDVVIQEISTLGFLPVSILRVYGLFYFRVFYNGT